MTDLGGPARRLARRWWVVVAAVVVGALASTTYLASGGRPWVSCTSVQVQPVLAEAVAADTPVRRLVLMDNELTVMEGPEVRQLASVTAGFRLRPEGLTVRVPPNSEVLRACYRDPSPDRAEAGARAVGDAYRLVRLRAVDSATELALTAAGAARAAALEDATTAASDGGREDAARVLDVLDRRIAALRALDEDGSRVLSAPLPAVVDTEHVRLVLVSGLALSALAGATVAIMAPVGARRG